MSQKNSSVKGTVRLVGLLGAPLAAALSYYLLTGSMGLDHAGRATVAVAVWMAGWWLTEPVPLGATALLPICLFPLLGIASVDQATAPYGNKLIFLFMGGCMIACAIERWNLHRRFALHTIRLVGSRPTRLSAGFMIATALMSMWVSNTATTVTMLPIGASVIGLVLAKAGDNADRKATENFAACMVLSIAYGASIGGVGTLIGTPTNAVLAAFLDSQYEVKLTVAQWLPIGLPLVVLFLPICWLILTRIVFPTSDLKIPGGSDWIDSEIRGLGRMSPPERRVLVVFASTALAWIFLHQIHQVISWIQALILPTAELQVHDTVVAIIGASALFVIPTGQADGQRLLDWKTAQKIPWEVLILFGGGLTLADAIKRNGVASYIGLQFRGLEQPSELLLIGLVAVVVIFLTEITSNVATTSAFLPVLVSVATGLGFDPFKLLLPATLASSFAFMLPMATPPNALVFSSGYVTIRQMCRAGLLLNIVGGIVISLWVWLAAPSIRLAEKLM